MTIQVQERIEDLRGCGWRKPGGIYLVGPPTGQDCCKLPLELTVCPTCGHGIHPARGWTWVEANKLFQSEVEGCRAHDRKLWAEVTLRPCPLSNPNKLGKAGLLWVGEAFYKTPADFLDEARRMGLSRRIHSVPKGFRLGETWVLLAHRKAIPETVPVRGGLPGAMETVWKPGIFSLFRPTALEYVVKGDETELELEHLAMRGLTPVVVKRGSGKIGQY